MHQQLSLLVSIHSPAIVGALTDTGAGAGVGVATGAGEATGVVAA